ncbi:MAG TPA: bifunctional 23S rRNA (guanine(2069)-N(7))-methyltransferase RlmK/23S rRNA (guanine(2445)-N(2))-methyltransferase RlmL [Nevskiaceae bacterium]|nr:bifunctional 23S rRNA (guanine(2069)-N(7))-methyltransferase RlmK/23S rRNA (guanine(2445)-N(2))-methyltransferase RlmL [Nevskiaceae bacterium]
MTAALDLFVTCPRGLEPLLAAELSRLGATQAKERAGGVACSGDRALAYRACLWSRLASRVLLPLARFPVQGPDDLYAEGCKIDWPALFGKNATFAVEVAGRMPAIPHTHYAGLKVKDAIVDTFRDRMGGRPNVDTDAPDLRVHLHLDREGCGLSLDLSGESLHRRGYRGGAGEAPLKENLACALLIRAGWPEIAAAGGTLIDPMCGSGTFLVEAAWIAGDVAPGLMRERFGFEAWTGHDPAAWRALRDEAFARREAGRARIPKLVGNDLDERVLAHARRNAQAAGVANAIEFRTADLLALRPAALAAGLVMINPPYGERLGAEAEVIKLYSLIGAWLKRHFGGWRAAVFTARPDLGPRIGLRADAMHAFYNGDLPAKLLQFAVQAASGEEPASDFANRLDKNLRHLEKWARRNGVTSYRAYDGDLPDYAVAVDLYQSDELHVHVQEYAAPDTIDPVKAEKRLREALDRIQSRFELPASRLHFKTRAVQRGTAQYEKQNEASRAYAVEEHGCRFWLNFEDYLDTGLFLDHRPIRRRLQAEAAGKRVLNLFCYTGTASVHAARGGAVRTVSVDLSNTYLEWAERNFRLNGIEPTYTRPREAKAATSDPWGGRMKLKGRREQAPPPRRTPHELVRADCLVWLEQAAKSANQRFDLVFCDPPTFSNSKKMPDVFDVERDQLRLVEGAMAVLAPGGVLYFSTNKRRFKLDPAISAGFQVDDITASTLDEDFKRPPPPHRCWRITAT